jgi:hypothetical protein
VGTLRQDHNVIASMKTSIRQNLQRSRTQFIVR